MNGKQAKALWQASPPSTTNTYTPTLKEVSTWVWSERSWDGNRSKKWRTHLSRGVTVRNEARAAYRRMKKEWTKAPRPEKADRLGPWPGWPFI